MSSKDRIATLRKRVATDPYDAEAWEKLVSEADRARRGSERNAALTAVYEDLLNVFPTAVGPTLHHAAPPLARCRCRYLSIRRLCSRRCRRGTGGSMQTTR